MPKPDPVFSPLTEPLLIGQAIEVAATVGREGTDGYRRAAVVAPPTLWNSGYPDVYDTVKTELLGMLGRDPGAGTDGVKFHRTVIEASDGTRLKIVGLG